MAREVTAVIRRLTRSALASVGGLSVPASLLAVAVAFTVFLWVVTVAPSLFLFALTIALAIAWCVWLEEHPDPQLTCGTLFEAIPAASRAKVAIHVLATTAEGTKCALEAARRLTGGTDDKVVLFVPRRLTAFGAPFDLSGQERTATIDRYRQIAVDVGVHVRVLLCVCRRPEDVVHLLLGTSALLIVGGSSRWWWPTRERRLVDRLVSEGYSTVFADIGAARRRALARSRLLSTS